MADTRLQRADDDLAQIRESVRALCARFPGEYWRGLDRERAYPSEFVTALTQAGFLAALIPEEYGGSGLAMTAAAAIMEEIQASGCNGAACHAQMYTMGTLLRHGSAAQKARWLPAIAVGGAAPAGLRRHRADLRLRYAQSAHHCGARGRPLHHQRAENLDVARRAFGSAAAACAHDPTRAGDDAHRRAFGLSCRHAARAGHRHQHPTRSAP